LPGNFLAEEREVTTVWIMLKYTRISVVIYEAMTYDLHGTLWAMFMVGGGEFSPRVSRSSLFHLVDRLGIMNLSGLRFEILFCPGQDI
jgi:hypothetical protein